MPITPRRGRNNPRNTQRSTSLTDDLNRRLAEQQRYIALYAEMMGQSVITPHSIIDPIPPSSTDGVIQGGGNLTVSFTDPSNSVQFVPGMLGAESPYTWRTYGVPVPESEVEVDRFTAALAEKVKASVGKNRSNNTHWHKCLECGTRITENPATRAWRYAYDPRECQCELAAGDGRVCEEHRDLLWRCPLCERMCFGPCCERCVATGEIASEQARAKEMEQEHAHYKTEA
jgi:hypothetical protein